jgi:hypothetical protein
MSTALSITLKEVVVAGQQLLVLAVLSAYAVAGDDAFVAVEVVHQLDIATDKQVNGS